MGQSLALRKCRCRMISYRRKLFRKRSRSHLSQSCQYLCRNSRYIYLMKCCYSYPCYQCNQCYQCNKRSELYSALRYRCSIICSPRFSRSFRYSYCSYSSSSHKYDSTRYYSIRHYCRQPQSKHCLSCPHRRSYWTYSSDCRQ